MTRQFVFAALGLLLTHALSWAEPQHVADTRIESATLISKTGVREVALPHALDTKDIEAQGSRVLYRMKIELAQIPDRPLGIYIGKVSLSGRVSLNGQWTEPCGYGELEDLRCLHRPFLFRPAVQTWQAGTNWLEVEVYGTPMQVNGLSSIRVGDAQALYREVYIPKLWLSITTKEFLAIAAVVLGLLSLAIGLTWREASIYRWYAGMCLMFAASSFNLVSDQVAMPIDWVNRIVISTRLGAALFALLTSLSFFDKLKNWHIVFALFYGLGTLTLAEIFDENRWLIAAAYVPVLATTLAISVLSMVWSWESKSKWQLTMSLNYFLLMGVGVGDWMSYGGLQSFEYVYMLPYAFSIFLLFIGLSVASQLTASLRRTRELSSNLEAQVHSRTLELASALETIQQMERTALKVTESIPVGTYVLEVTPQGQPCFTDSSHDSTGPGHDDSAPATARGHRGIFPSCDGGRDGTCLQTGHPCPGEDALRRCQTGPRYMADAVARRAAVGRRQGCPVG